MICRCTYVGAPVSWVESDMDNWEKRQNWFEGLLSTGLPNSVFGNPGKSNYRPTTLKVLKRVSNSWCSANAVLAIYPTHRMWGRSCAQRAQKIHRPSSRTTRIAALTPLSRNTMSTEQIKMGEAMSYRYRGMPSCAFNSFLFFSFFCESSTLTGSRLL